MKTIPGLCTLAIASALLLAACKSNDDSNLLVTNGKETTSTNMPFVAEFTTGSGYCSATVIGPNAVLSAAHCVGNGAASRMSIKTSEGTFRVKAYEVHPTYRQTRGGAVDLALLTIEGTHQARSSLCRESPKAGREIVIAGWGNFEYPARRDTTGKLRYGYNRLDSVDGNGLQFRGTAIGPGTGEKVGAGTGDSGGPMFLLQEGHGLGPAQALDGKTLIAKSTLVGATSGGNSTGNTTFETYADACAARAWIDQAAARLGARIEAPQDQTPPPSPQTPDKDVFLALGLAESTGTYHLYVGASDRAQSVKVCRSTALSSCTDAPQATLVKTTGGRKIFKSASPEALASGTSQQFSIVAFGADARIVSSIQVRIEPK